jgi:hypothetical protein
VVMIATSYVHQVLGMWGCMHESSLDIGSLFGLLKPDKI